MTISELIAAPQALQDEFGDLQVKTGIAADAVTQAYLVSDDDDYYVAIDTAD